MMMMYHFGRNILLYGQEQNMPDRHILVSGELEFGFKLVGLKWGGYQAEEGDNMLEWLFNWENTTFNDDP